MQKEQENRTDSVTTDFVPPENWFTHGESDFENWPKDIPKGPAGKAWLIQVMSGSEIQQLTPRERSIYACHFGIIAPTTHNTSPEVFQVEEDGTAHIYLNLHFVLPASDPVGRHAEVSIGAVAENTIQALNAMGLSTIITNLFVEESQIRPSKEHNLIRLLTITPQGEVSEEVDTARLTAMKERRTNRAEYDNRPLPESLRNELELLAVEFPSLKLNLITSRPVIQAFSRFQQKADNYVVSGNELFRRELASWLRFNDDAESSRGMNCRQFGQRDDTFLEQLTGQKELIPTNLKAFAKAGQRGLASSSALAVISHFPDNNEVARRIEVGRLYEQTALLLQSNGWSTSMHAALTETHYLPIKVVSESLKRIVLKDRQLVPTAVFRVGIPRHEEDFDRPHSNRPFQGLITT